MSGVEAAGEKPVSSGVHQVYSGFSFRQCPTTSEDDPFHHLLSLAYALFARSHGLQHALIMQSWKEYKTPLLSHGQKTDDRHEPQPCTTFNRAAAV
eukprot:22656-Eustigmatos_ZCMA.PRE.1